MSSTMTQLKSSTVSLVASVDSSTPSLPALPKTGEFCPAKPSDLRSPCPLLNAMANHGYLPRDGRNIHPAELKKAMDLTGLSNLMGATLAYPTYLEDVPRITSQGKVADATKAAKSFFSRIWFYIRNPWALVFPQFGVWMPGQNDSKGRRFVNLDQIASHQRIEHDVSLTRKDFQQGDNNTLQKDLVEQLLDSSSDGGWYLTLEDLCAFQKKRIEDQRRENPKAVYGPDEFQVSCGQIAMTLRAFGDSKSVRCDYIRALFAEERLPIAEGWTRRKWWTMGLFEVVRAIEKVKSLVGKIEFSGHP
jgi:hypothetical protein